MDIYLRAYLPRVAMSVVFAVLVWLTPHLLSNGEFPFYYYIVIALVFAVHQVHIDIIIIVLTLKMFLCLLQNLWFCC